jgi:thymidylate kinase
MTSSFDELLYFNKKVTDLLVPDLTIFIDTDPAASLGRILATRIGEELFDRDGTAIRENFLKAIEMLDGVMKVLTIDGNMPEEVITDEIWKHVEGLFV